MLAYRNAQPTDQLWLTDRGFQYGDGCFSTARIVHNHWQLRERHLQRLENACRVLNLSADLTFIEQSLIQLQYSQTDLNGVLKIIISRGAGGRGYAMPDQPADVYVLYYPQGQFCCGSAYSN